MIDLDTIRQTVFKAFHQVDKVTISDYQVKTDFLNQCATHTIKGDAKCQNGGSFSFTYTLETLEKEVQSR